MRFDKLDNSRAWLDNMPPSIHSTRKTALRFEVGLLQLTGKIWHVTVDTSPKGLGGLRIAPEESRLETVSGAPRISKADWEDLRRIWLAIPNAEAEFWYVFPDEIAMFLDEMAKITRFPYKGRRSNERKDRDKTAA